MTIVLVGLSWLLLSSVGLLGAVACCRAGHAEDVARGYSAR